MTVGSGYGIEVPRPHAAHDEQPPVRYVVLIDSAGSGMRLARLYLASREAVGEFSAAAPEIQQMTEGLQPAQGATAPEWDDALAGHSGGERRDAEVFTLDV